jgi:serine/threonine protein kinase
VVWLGKNAEGQLFAMKQFPFKDKKQVDNSAKVEFQVQSLLKRYTQPADCENLCMMHECIEDRKDLWLIYELCSGTTLSDHLGTVKGEFYKNERVYKVQHGSLYYALRNDLTLLADFLRRLASALATMSRLCIVHADLKPENIIVDFDEESGTIKSLKIIDFGSAFILSPEGHSLEH